MNNTWTKFTAMSFYLQSLIVLMTLFVTYKEVNAACEVRSDGAICCHVETICDDYGVCKPGGRVECDGGISSGGNGGGGSCQVTCKSNGVCEVRKSGFMGSCFPPSFGH